MMKLCFAASSGGHMEELSRLAGVIGGRESFLITEAVSNSTAPSFCDRVYTVRLVNRKEFLFPVRLMGLLIRSFQILRKERPDCVITTGALAGYPVSLAAKLMGKKIIYVESFARVHSASLTGKLIYPFADLFIVQWEEMLKKYPRAVYGGWLV